ncbi:MAG: S-methyl-5-thioribose-1-phosphate isomerase [Chloroflexi bacterium]|nr:S-methyl-5-thioribose-1-phosphate isomerase [Chloroflexota bacterium]
MIKEALAAIDQFTGSLRQQGLLLPVWFEQRRVMMLDQTALPFRRDILPLDTVEKVAEAIVAMKVRGSGSIASTVAYGLLLAGVRSGGDPSQLREAAALLRRARPTAAAPLKAIDLITAKVSGLQGEELVVALQRAVIEFVEAQLADEKGTGKAGAELMRDGMTMLTHCHAGALAGVGYGGRTLSVVRQAMERGYKIKVIACETRPYLQGARITAWEFQQLGIPVILITDNMAGFCLQRRMADIIIVGSDRVAANGDVANKVGTYMLALAAADNDVPFYVATSRFNIDLSTPTGGQIPIEMRDADEVLYLGTQRIAPEGVGALYPSFDVTPARLVRGLITPLGVVSPPYEANLARLFGA